VSLKFFLNREISVSRKFHEYGNSVANGSRLGKSLTRCESVGIGIVARGELKLLKYSGVLIRSPHFGRFSPP